MSRPSIYGIAHSPWSERARWALDLHDIDYRWHDYIAMLGEPLLRLRTGTFSGKMTAPVLVADREVVRDSVDIAHWAEERGRGSSLFPNGAHDPIEGWCNHSDRMLEAGRALVAHSTAADEDALAAMIPFPKPLRRRLLFVGRLGVRFLARKYDFEDVPVEQLANTLRAELEHLRAALRGRSFLLGDSLSFADITCACALQFVEPVDDRWIELGYHARRTMCVPELADEFRDLIDWRDRLYAEYR